MEDKIQQSIIIKLQVTAVRVEQLIKLTQLRIPLKLGIAQLLTVLINHKLILIKVARIIRLTRTLSTLLLIQLGPPQTNLANKEAISQVSVSLIKLINFRYEQ